MNKFFRHEDAFRLQYQCSLSYILIWPISGEGTTIERIFQGIVDTRPCGLQRAPRVELRGELDSRKRAVLALLHGGALSWCPITHIRREFVDIHASQGLATAEVLIRHLAEFYAVVKEAIAACAL